MLNVVHIHGRLTDDPHLSQTKNKHDVCNFTLATNEKYKDRDGKEQESTCFVPVTLWGDLAAVVHKHKRKGHPVIVTGKLTLEQWKDKADGKNRERLIVTAFAVEFLPHGDKDGRKDDRGRSDDRGRPDDRRDDRRADYDDRPDGRR